MDGRRGALARLAALAAAPLAARAAPVSFPQVTPGVPLAFPADFGSHPDFRTEWWYVTGWLEDTTHAPLGFQVTFFRHRPGIAEGRASRFAPQQLLLAHAAVADPARGRLRTAERAARAGFGLAEAAVGNTEVHVGDWSMRRSDRGYRLHVPAAAFLLDLDARPTQPVLLEGERGYSRKGPLPTEASFYYSEPALEVSGTITIGGARRALTGRAWCDHEWSSEYLPAAAAGWDWTGLNLDDGTALMAFVMRGRDGGALWAGATLRAAGGAPLTFGPDAVRFVPQRTWRSPRTGAIYPVAMEVTVGAARFALAPLFDDQEQDARASTGTVYWEGAVRAARDGVPLGRGYLELTGYAGVLRM